jgi:hypothetical protein
MTSPTSPAKSPPTKFSNNEPAITDSLEQGVSVTDQDHPDAPLPIGQTETGSNQSSNQNQSEGSTYRCESGSESEVQAALAQSEPRPIEDDYDDAAVAAARPRHAWQVLWLRNKGMALVLLAQMFGASMNVMTQILEIHSAMHPFQVSRRKRITQKQYISPLWYMHDLFSTSSYLPSTYALTYPKPTHIYD